MTATLPPPPPNEAKPWTARMLEATVFAKVGRGRQQGYDMGEVDAFKARAISRVTDLERELTAAVANWQKNHEALVLKSSEHATDRHAWNGPGATAAVEAIVRGQHEAELNSRNAAREIARQFDEVRRMQAEAERTLAEARDAAAGGPPELVLPPEPDDVAAKVEWLAECCRLVDEYRAGLADYEAALERRLDELGESQAAIVARQRDLAGRRSAALAEVDQLRSKLEAVPVAGDVDEGEAEPEGDESEGEPEPEPDEAGAIEVAEIEVAS